MAKVKKLDAKRIHNLLSCATFAVALASTVCITGPAHAAVPTSQNLPVPNYVNGATMQYNNGVNVQTSIGGLVTNQAVAAAAANTAKKLSIDLGTTAGKVADIGYNDFNIGQNANVNFNFGAAGQTALNRVTKVGTAYASKIYGSMTQTGTGGSVFLINPNGILFGAKSSVNLNSLAVSTLQVKDNDLKTTGEITLAKVGNPAGVYFEGPGNIATNQSIVVLGNSIYNKNKNFQAGNNLDFITGDKVELQVANDGTIGFPPGDETGHDFVTPSADYHTTVTLPNGVSTLLGSITSKSGKLNAPSFTVIAELNKNLKTQYQDIVNISSALNAGTVFMYADNKLADTPTNGKLNIITGNIKSTGANGGDIEITADGKITTGDITTNGDVLLGTNNLFHNFGPSDLQSQNMAQDYLIHGLTGDSITTGSIKADDLIAIGKSITTKDINVRDTAALIGVQDLSVFVNNTDSDPFGIEVDFTGGAVRTRNVDAENFVALGSSIQTGVVEAENAVLLGISDLKLDLAYDLSHIDLHVDGGYVKNPAIVAENAVVFGSDLDLGYVDADLAALLSVKDIDLSADIDPTILNVDLSPFMTGNITADNITSIPSTLPILQPISQLGYINADVKFVNGDLDANTVEAENAILLGSKVNVESVNAENLFAFGIQCADAHLDAGQYLPFTVNFEGHLTGGDVNIGDISAEHAIELGANINSDTVSAEDYAALAVKDAELEFQFTAGNFPTLPALAQDMEDLISNHFDNQAYLFASLTTTNGNISIDSISADTAVLLGSKIYAGDVSNVDHLLKVNLPSIDISYNPQDEYEY